MNELIDTITNQGVAVALCIYLLWEKRQDKSGGTKTMAKMSNHIQEIALILRERMPDHKIIAAVR